ncbi:MAG: CpsD/CapB family tyrosine-protein kinase, partial [Lachnoclostridium sp.]|nr:CpsD/CapB family tyrosine-protein kinase [Lachnoclostridium sp.]
MKKIDIYCREMSYATREALKTLRTNILFCGDDKKVLLVTSCVPGEGKTRNAIDLAYSITQLNKSVILVDADMRKSVMVSRLQVQNVDKGLSHFLSGQCTLAEAVVATNVPKLHLLLSGPLVPNPTELLSSERFKALIESLRKVYDYVVIDTPPLGMVIDSAIIAKNCDGAIMVVESAKTKYRLAQNVKEK